MAEALVNQWKSRLQNDCPDLSPTTQDSIIRWLLGNQPERFNTLAPAQMTIAQQAMDFLFGILRQRYLGVPPEQAYRRLLQRLSSLVLLRQKIRAWVALSHDRQRSVLDVLQEVIQEMLNSDRYLQQQMAWIAECTPDRRLRNTLLLTNLEEYCLRPIRNQPLLLYRFVNYLRRSQRGGMTQIPTGDWVKLVSEDIISEESDGPLSRLDQQAISDYQDNQMWEEQQALRFSVQQEFERYLEENVEPLAAQWLRLYLQGRSQEAIAAELKIPIKQIYRLREKVSYHAIRVFATKQKPELVAQWLEVSLNEHNLGLTSHQWQQFWGNMSPTQRQIIDQLKAGQPIDTIAQNLKLKTHQVISEWSQLYLAAQDLRRG